MSKCYPLFVTDVPLDANMSKAHFLLTRKEVFEDRKDGMLENLVFEVSRNPTELLNHLRRIYCCYSQNLPEQLCAALIDLLIVLAGKGKLLTRRMILGSLSIMDGQQIAMLEKYLKTEDVNELTVNPYSVLSQNLIGTNHLVTKKDNQDVQRDYLDMANDFIEYSQLNSAIEILEKGFTEQPDRTDVQKALLELYKSTEDAARFNTAFKAALQNHWALIPEWRQVDAYFNTSSS